MTRYAARYLREAHKRIEELEAEICPNCDLLEKDVERLRESEKFFADRCGDAELRLLELQRKHGALVVWANQFPDDFKESTAYPALLEDDDVN